MTIIITFLPRDIGEIRRSGYCFGASEKTTLFEARIAAELIRGPADVEASAFASAPARRDGAASRRDNQRPEIRPLR
jgi:hypothetical protein